MSLRAMISVVYGITLGIFTTLMLYNHWRKMRNLAPGTTPWRAMLNPGNQDPEVYTTLGNVYRRRETMYRIAWYVTGVAWFFTDSWLARLSR